MIVKYITFSGCEYLFDLTKDEDKAKFDDWFSNTSCEGDKIEIIKGSLD